MANKKSTAWVSDLKSKIASATSGDNIAVDNQEQKDWAMGEITRLNKTGVTVSIKLRLVQVGNLDDPKEAAKALYDQIMKVSKPAPKADDAHEENDT